MRKLGRRGASFSNAGNSALSAFDKCDFIFLHFFFLWSGGDGGGGRADSCLNGVVSTNPTGQTNVGKNANH